DTSALQAVLDRALAKQPERRFGGMMELARAFEDAAARTVGTASAPGLGEAARAARAHVQAHAPRLDDAAIDTPPPVRTPAPLVLKPIRRIPTPAPTPTPTATPAPVRRAPLPMDWELRNDIDEVPTNHTRAAVLGLLLLAAVGVPIVTGWYKKLPGAAGTLRRQIHEWTGPSGAAPQTGVEPAPLAEPPVTAPQPAPAGAGGAVWRAGAGSDAAPARRKPREAPTAAGAGSRAARRSDRGASAGRRS